MHTSFLFVVARLLFAAQMTTSPSDVLRVGPGITPPRLLHKKEPEYSPIARADHIQGTVVLQLIVDERGRPTNVTVLSPLGFGLDEGAQAAVETWQFAPGVKDGKPVKILATVEVNFRFPQIWFDEKKERQRTAFNIALQDLRRPGANQTAIDRAVKSMQDLSRQKFPPAMYVIGLWEMDGEHLPKDAGDGFSLIQKAAEKNYGPALYQVGLHRMNGQDLTKDVQKGLEEIRQAATLGSPQAQLDLGNRYESGDGVAPESDRARRYFRLCAAQGIETCQYRLGASLLNRPDRSESDYIQAIAWLELAAEKGLADAKNTASKEVPGLTQAQSNWVSALKTQLAGKQGQ